MQSLRKEHLYKVLVIGDLGVGKTSIIRRYVHQTYSTNYRATIGVDFALKVLNWDSETVRLQLWDIAGERVETVNVFMLRNFIFWMCNISYHLPLLLQLKRRENHLQGPVAFSFLRGVIPFYCSRLLLKFREFYVKMCKKSRNSFMKKVKCYWARLHVLVPERLMV